eukprot:UN4331
MCADGHACSWGAWWPRPPQKYGTTPAFAENWTLVEYQYDGLYGDGREEPEHHLVFQAYEMFDGQLSLSHNCRLSYVADIRVNDLPVGGPRRLEEELDNASLSEDVLLDGTLTDAAILKAFQLFDDEGTGVLTIENFQRVGERFGEPMTDDELQEMMGGADLDGNGEVFEEEFLRSAKTPSVLDF